MCIFAHGITSDFGVSEKCIISIQCKARQRDQIMRHYCVCSLQKKNLEPSKLVGIVTGGAPSVDYL